MFTTNDHRAPFSAVSCHRDRAHRRPQRLFARRASSIAKFALVVAMACGAAAALPASSALAAGTWSAGVQASLPANAGTNPQVFLSSVSCASAGNCSAVGDYDDNAGDGYSVLLDENSGTWDAGVEASLPANAASNPPDSGMGPVSCTSAGNCTAAGSYADTSQNYQAMMLDESSGTWAPAVEAPLPANAASNPYADPTSMSCPSVGNCTAVGTYTDATGAQQGVVYDETSGTWTAEEAPLPADAASNPQVFLPSVSCASAGNCSAVGTYYDSAGAEVVLALDENSGTWATGVLTSTPPNAGTIFNVFDVSSASAGNCDGVGAYVTDDESERQIVPLLLEETSGTWTAEEGPVPADAATVYGGTQLENVSCASAGNCVATGGYIDSSNNDQGLLLVERRARGRWQTQRCRRTPPRAPMRTSARCRVPRSATARPSAATTTLRATRRRSC